MIAKVYNQRRHFRKGRTTSRMVKKKGAGEGGEGCEW